RGDLLTVAGAADDDAEAARVGHGAPGGLDAEGRVVVVRVVDMRSDVGQLVTESRQAVDEVGLQLEAGMIGADVDAHVSSVPPAVRGGPIQVLGTVSDWQSAQVVDGVFS